LTFGTYRAVFWYELEAELQPSSRAPLCPSSTSVVPTFRLPHLQTHPAPSRDEKPVIATPLESAFTKRDARNPFGMCIYENCRVLWVFPAKNASTFTFTSQKIEARHEPLNS
jgi:hypothetical protein